ncbi:MAG: alpha-isopropylmalate synthase regulatory domain-containing protein, partial [Thiomicrorhabdus sp.]|nr:alpha-isopropylmalate synthase regulatory domain-containing protein [Thiomicrorhabdus sp.]
RIVNGQGSDTDIVTASAKAYINALNKLAVDVDKAHPQAPV